MDENVVVLLNIEPQHRKVHANNRLKSDLERFGEVNEIIIISTKTRGDCHLP